MSFSDVAGAATPAAGVFAAVIVEEDIHDSWPDMASFPFAQTSTWRGAAETRKRVSVEVLLLTAQNLICVCTPNSVYIQIVIDADKLACTWLDGFVYVHIYPFFVVVVIKDH